MLKLTFGKLPLAVVLRRRLVEQEYKRDWPETAIRRALLHPAILTDYYSGEQNMFFINCFSENMQ